MALVKFVRGTAENFALLGTKDQDTLYISASILAISASLAAFILLCLHFPAQVRQILFI